MIFLPEKEILDIKPTRRSVFDFRQKKGIKREQIPLNVGVFTVAEINAANARHDAFYGWSRDCATVYTNIKRLPETVFGPPFQTALAKAEGMA